MTKFNAEDFTTCEMCGKDSADKEGYCAECEHTTHQCEDNCRSYGCRERRQC